MIRSRAQDRLLPIKITCFYEELPLPGTSCSSLAWDGLTSGVYLYVGVMLMLDEHRDA